MSRHQDPKMFCQIGRRCRRAVSSAASRPEHPQRPPKGGRGRGPPLSPRLSPAPWPSTGAGGCGSLGLKEPPLPPPPRAAAGVRGGRRRGGARAEPRARVSAFSSRLRRRRAARQSENKGGRQWEAGRGGGRSAIRNGLPAPAT